MTIAIEILALTSIFLALSCYMLHLVNDKGHEQREETIRSLRKREAELMAAKLAEEKAHGLANIKRDAAERELAELKSAILKVGVILGFTDDDEDEESKPAPAPAAPPPTPHPQRFLYAVSVISCDADEYNGDHSCWLVNATSKDEARGVVCRLAEAEYPDGYDVAWAGAAVEPEKA